MQFVENYFFFLSGFRVYGLWFFKFKILYGVRSFISIDTYFKQYANFLKYHNSEYWATIDLRSHFFEYLIL